MTKICGVRKKVSIEMIAGDGNCLYACLGRSRKIPGDRVRQIIHDNAERLWKTHMHHDVEGTELIEFKTELLTEQNGVNLNRLLSGAFCSY